MGPYPHPPLGNINNIEWKNVIYWYFLIIFVRRSLGYSQGNCFGGSEGYNDLDKNWYHCWILTGISRNNTVWNIIRTQLWHNWVLGTWFLCWKNICTCMGIIDRILLARLKDDTLDVYEIVPEDLCEFEIENSSELILIDEIPNVDEIAS